MDNNIYVFYSKNDKDGRYIKGFNSISAAKNFAENLYRNGYGDISLRRIGDDDEIRKTMYKIIYNKNGKMRLTSFIGYSDNSDDTYHYISVTMKEMGIKYYTVIPIDYDKFLKTFKIVKSHKENTFMHNISKGEYNESLSNLFQPRV